MAEQTIDQLSCDEVAEYAAFYALDALEPELRADVEHHLTRCDLHDEVGEFRDTARLLAAATVTPVEPSASLLDRVRQSTAAPPGAVTPTSEAPPAIEAPTPLDGASPRADPNARRARALVLSYPVAAAMALFFVLVGTLGVWLALDGQDDAGAAQHFVVGDAHGTQLSYLPDDRLAYLSLERLDPAPNDHAYQVWLIHDDNSTPLGFIAPAVAGGPASVRLSAELEPGDSVIVTVEPVGGSTEPSTEALVTALVD